jgi:hypothetical protein
MDHTLTLRFRRFFLHPQCNACGVRMKKGRLAFASGRFFPVESVAAAAKRMRASTATECITQSSAGKGGTISSIDTGTDAKDGVGVHVNQQRLRATHAGLLFAVSTDSTASCPALGNMNPSPKAIGSPDLPSLEAQRRWIVEQKQRRQSVSSIEPAQNTNQRQRVPNEHQTHMAVSALAQLQWQRNAIESIPTANTEVAKPKRRRTIPKRLEDAGDRSNLPTTSSSDFFQIHPGEQIHQIQLQQDHQIQQNYQQQQKQMQPKDAHESSVLPLRLSQEVQPHQQGVVQVHIHDQSQAQQLLLQAQRQDQQLEPHRYPAQLLSPTSQSTRSHQRPTGLYSLIAAIEFVEAE